MKVNSGNVDLHHYRPQRSCGKVMFSQASVILSTGGGGVWQIPPGRHPPGQTPPWQTPLPGRHPRADTTQADTPLLSACWDKRPSPCLVHAGIHPPPAATAADGTHPTGMHSCWRICYRPKCHWSKTNKCTSGLDCGLQWIGMSDLRILGWKRRIFTARQRSCVKVVLSQVSVILFRRRGPMWPLPMM